MGSSGENFNRVPKNKEDVEAHLAKLQYALQSKSTLIELQGVRHTDLSRQKKHTNVFTIAELFPNESPRDAMKRELASLEIGEYIETVRDTRYPKLSDFWVFGRQYGEEDVYIKFRIEIIERDYIFVMSFHFSTIPFSKVCFPFAKKGG